MLPLEVDFLNYYQKFEDDEKIEIINTLTSYAKSTPNSIIFNENIDKRKYSYVKNWSEKLLSNIDVDMNLKKLLHWEQQIMSDNIALGDEKELLKVIQNAESSDFNFQKIYDISRTYRHYLQIRLRHDDYQKVHLFLTEKRTDYEFSKLVNDKLHESTNEIISDYSYKNKVNYTDLFPWLSSLFFNEKLDGYNRILAWIRMVFIAHNKRQYDLLQDAFVYFDKMIANGKFYSRRIVINFYSQYLLYFASRYEFDKAIYYGQLSIKEKNNDFLYYANNLVAVMLRSNQSEEALRLLRETSVTAQYEVNFHNKISHAAYTIFALIDTQKSKQAENHAFVFYNAYKKEIFQHRWHLFFNAFFKAMILNENYSEIIKLTNHQKLISKDEMLSKNSNYTPSIPWIYYLASFKNGDIASEKLKTKLHSFIDATVNIATNNSFDDLIKLTKKVLRSDFEKMEISHLFL